MKWFELHIHITQEAVEPVSNILHESGASGVVIEDPQDLQKEWESNFGEVYELNPEDYPEEGVIIKAYLAENEAFNQTVETIKQEINQLKVHNIDLGYNKIIVNEVDEEEWATAWKRYYHPVHVSDHITIVPTWEEYERKQPNETIIELDPGMAFGTGTHPTTVMCIQAIEKVLQNNDKMIDVGTGSGVLSIAAAKLGASNVEAFDLDDVAVKSAVQNVESNDMQYIVTVKQNNLLDHVTDSVDLVVANLLAEIIVRFPGDVANVLKPDGLYITSGIICSKQQEVKDKLIDTGFSIEETLEMEDWVAFIAKNRR